MEEKKTLENLTMEYQRIREQMQSVNMQKDRYSSQKTEYGQAEAEISKAKGKIYSAVGAVIIEVDKEEAQKQITEKKELIETRLTILNKQSNTLADKEKQLREELESILKRDH